MTNFHPHHERELPLAQWTYELVLENLIRIESETHAKFLEQADFNYFDKTFWLQQATASAIRLTVLRDELNEQEGK